MLMKQTVNNEVRNLALWPRCRCCGRHFNSLKSRSLFRHVVMQRLQWHRLLTVPSELIVEAHALATQAS